MTEQEERRLLEYIAHPPEGSKVASAKAYGIDLTLNVQMLKLTPTERIQQLHAMGKMLKEMRRAGSSRRR